MPGVPHKSDEIHPSPACGRGAGGEGGKFLQRAKQLRTNQTDAEKRLWYHLRAHRFMGLKFKRQKPIGNYIVDFVCLTPKLIVELDGGQHAEQVAYDERRDTWLRAQGFVVLRFWNHEVLTRTDAVLESIRQEVFENTLSPGPSPASGRGGKSIDACDGVPASGRGGKGADSRDGAPASGRADRGTSDE